MTIVIMVKMSKLTAGLLHAYADDIDDARFGIDGRTSEDVLG